MVRIGQRGYAERIVVGTSESCTYMISKWWSLFSKEISPLTTLQERRQNTPFSS